MTCLLCTICLVLCASCNLASNENFKSDLFVRSEQEKALIGHVIKTSQAPNDMDCLIECNQHKRCISYNYKNTGVGIPVCQLNNESNESKPDDLIAVVGFYYYGPQASCHASNPCQHGGTCVPENNHPTLRHRCLCDAAYTGLNCDVLATDSNSNFDVKFPRRDTKDYVKLAKMPSLMNLTISFTVKLSVDGDHTFISYATSTKQNMLFIHQRKSKFYCWIDNKNNIFTDTSGSHIYLTKDGKWHHVVLTWQSTNGKLQLYIDGKLKSSKTGFQTGLSVVGGGLLVLGNDQDSYGGGFVVSDALVGTITRVNVWNNILSADIITKHMRSCGNEVGTAVAWKDFKKPGASYHGQATSQDPSRCT